MAPRRGGGGGGSGFGGSGEDDYNNPYYYDPDAIYSPSEMNGWRALVATASLLLIAAVIALVMVLIRSWLKRDGTRNKSRLSVFVVCLVSIIICRAIVITRTVAILNGPNIRTTSVDPYYTQSIFTNAPFASFVFDLISIGLFLGLTLIEITRRNRQIDHKRTGSETFGFITILVVVAVNLTSWILSILRYTRGASAVYEYPVVIMALTMTYGGVAFLFALVLLAMTPKKASPEPIPKSQSRYLRLLARAVWVGQSLDLSIICIGFFYLSLRRLTIQLALTASADVMWIVKIFTMTLLAWDCHKQYKTELTYTSVMTAEQYDYAPPTYPSQQYVVPNTTYNPHGQGWQQQQQYSAVPNTAYDSNYSSQAWPKQPLVTTTHGYAPAYTPATQHWR